MPLVCEVPHTGQRSFELGAAVALDPKGTCCCICSRAMRTWGLVVEGSSTRGSPRLALLLLLWCSAGVWPAPWLPAPPSKEPRPPFSCTPLSGFTLLLPLPLSGFTLLLPLPLSGFMLLLSLPAAGLAASRVAEAEGVG